MKLESLRLENFQGIKHLELIFKGENATIYGDNATGKSTVFNALTWLMFDKPSTGAKNFTPKTKGPDGDLHHLDHSVEAALRQPGGRVVTLRKVYHEVYKTKRGSSAEVFAGHTTDYFIDGVPCSEKEFQTILQGFCSSFEKMKMLTMPDYFPEEMTREERREILLEVCGDVSDDEVILSTPDLEDLPGFLLMPGTTDQHYTVDEYKKIAAAKKAEINKELREIPGRIDEATRAMPDTAGLDPVKIERTIEDLTTQKEALETERAQARSGDTATATIRSQIAEANAELAEARAAHAARASSLNEDTYAAIARVRQAEAAAKDQLLDLQNGLRRAERELKELNGKRDALVSDYMAAQAETWDDDRETCPTCRRPLPQEEIREMREAFNLAKSNRLEKINQRGKEEASKEMVAEQEKTIKERRALTEKLESTVDEYKQQAAALGEQLQMPEPFEATQIYADLTARVAAYRNEEQDTDKRTEAITAGLTQKIEALREQIRDQEEAKAKIAQAAAQEQRIKELEGREQELSGEFEQIEYGIYLCELFIKTKVGLVTGKINDKFKSVSFRLFIEQLNGGVREDCEVMVPDAGGRMVPFAFANNAGRINAGLEIINTLSRHWGLRMPVFVDNAESVTRLLPIDAQVIRLVVSEADETLRMEIAN